MNALLDLETKLNIIAANPCKCKVCEHAARLAKRALIDISPSGSLLLDLDETTPEFREAEKKFQSDEIARLQEHYDYLSRGRCALAPDPVLDVSTNAAQERINASQLDVDPIIQERINHYYRKHSMKPRIHMKKNPRIPGTFVIK